MHKPPQDSHSNYFDYGFLLEAGFSPREASDLADITQGIEAVSGTETAEDFLQQLAVENGGGAIDVRLFNMNTGFGLPGFRP